MMEFGNLLITPAKPPAEEVFEELLRGSQFRMERIISSGQATPKGEWYDQESDEWVVLLTGAARLRFADGDREIEFQPGDYINIPAHRRHRVEWTDPEQTTVWLALHYQR